MILENYFFWIDRCLYIRYFLCVLLRKLNLNITHFRRSKFALSLIKRPNSPTRHVTLSFTCASFVLNIGSDWLVLISMYCCDKIWFSDCCALCRKVTQQKNWMKKWSDKLLSLYISPCELFALVCPFSHQARVWTKKVYFVKDVRKNRLSSKLRS